MVATACASACHPKCTDGAAGLSSAAATPHLVSTGQSSATARGVIRTAGATTRVRALRTFPPTVPPVACRTNRVSGRSARSDPNRRATCGGR
jgi:hypothetical protein